LQVSGRFRIKAMIDLARIEQVVALSSPKIAAIELVGGRVAEQILYSDLPPLPAEHDQAEVCALP
jgi:hypothetical protein